MGGTRRSDENPKLAKEGDVCRVKDGPENLLILGDTHIHRPETRIFDLI
jgi:hypothetical protein